MKPNIFDTATTELHQDAFISFLIKWANQNDHSKFSEDEKLLNMCGRDFLRQLISIEYPEFNEVINQIDVRRQEKGLDFSVRVNGRYLIVIQYKANSGFRNSQLKNYRYSAEKWSCENGYRRSTCVYFKNGNESYQTSKQIKKDGFHLYHRQAFLKLLQSFSDIQDHTFVDFKLRLESLEKVNNEYSIKAIKDWSGNDWQGFFQELEREEKITGWNFVNSPNGGFWNACLDWHSWDTYPVYMQLEQDKLCFKVSVSAKEGVVIPGNLTSSHIRNKYHSLIIEKSRENGIPHIVKPYKFGSGNYMTAAVVNCENWLGKPDEVINIEKVISNIELYTNFMKTHIANRKVKEALEN